MNTENDYARTELLVAIPNEKIRRCSIPTDWTPVMVVAELIGQEQLSPEAKPRDVLRNGVAIPDFDMERSLRSMGALEGDVLVVSLPGETSRELAIVPQEELLDLVETANGLLEIVASLSEYDRVALENTFSDGESMKLRWFIFIVKGWNAALDAVGE